MLSDEKEPVAKIDTKWSSTDDGLGCMFICLGIAAIIIAIKWVF